MDPANTFHRRIDDGGGGWCRQVSGNMGLADSGQPTLYGRCRMALPMIGDILGNQVSIGWDASAPFQE